MLTHIHPAFILGASGAGPLLIYIAAICVFFLSLWRPHWGLYFLVPLLPLQTLRYTLHPLPFGEKLVDFLLLGIILGLVINRRGRVFPHTPLNAFLIVWAVFHYVSLWRGAFYLDSSLPFLPSDPRFSNWKNYMVLPLIFMVVVAAIENKKQMKILLSLMIVGVLRNNIGFYNTVSGRDLTHFSYGLRYAGALGYAGENGLAAFEAQFALFCLGLYSFVKSRMAKIALIAFVISCVYCILFAFSRGGYVGLLTGLLFLGLVRERKHLIVIAVLLISWQTIVPTAVTERIFMTYENGQIDNSAGERLTMWQDAVTLIPQRPIFGTGFDTYEFMGRVEEFRDTHNLYLKILVETGILGLLLFLTLIGKSWLAGWRLFRTGEDDFFRGIGLGLAALFVCTLIVNFFGDRWMYLQVTGYSFVLLGLAVKAQLLSAEASEESVAGAESEEMQEALAAN